MSGALDSHRVAEYRRKISDPGYLTQALIQVAGILTETLAVPEHPEFRAARNGHGSFRGASRCD